MKISAALIITFACYLGSIQPLFSDGTIVVRLPERSDEFDFYSRHCKEIELDQNLQVPDQIFLPAGYYMMTFYYILHYKDAEALERRRAENIIYWDKMAEISSSHFHSPQYNEKVQTLINERAEKSIYAGRFNVKVIKEPSSTSLDLKRRLSDFRLTESEWIQEIRNGFDYNHILTPKRNLDLRVNLYVAGSTGVRGNIKEREVGKSQFVFFVDDPGMIQVNLLVERLGEGIVIEQPRLDFFYYVGKESRLLQELWKSMGVLEERARATDTVMAEMTQRLELMKKQRQELSLLAPVVEGLLLDNHDQEVNLSEIHEQLKNMMLHITLPDIAGIIQRIDYTLSDLIALLRVAEFKSLSFSELFKTIQSEQVQKALEMGYVTLDQRDRLRRFISARDAILNLYKTLEELEVAIAETEEAFAKMTLKKMDLGWQQQILRVDFIEGLQTKPTIQFPEDL